MHLNMLNTLTTNHKKINKKALIITDTFPFPPRNGMEVTCYQNVIEFIEKGIEIKFLILYSNASSKKDEELRYRQSNFYSEIEYIEIKEKSLFTKIIQELLLVSPTFLNYKVVNQSLDFSKLIENINFIFIPPVKGVYFYTKYLYKHINKNNITTILHTNDCISSYYYGTFLRMLKGFEKKTLLGFTYIIRYPFIKALEKSYLKKLDFCLVQTKQEKLKIKKMISKKIIDIKPNVLVKKNSPSKELFNLSYASSEMNILLMAHFIDNRAYSAIWFIEKVWDQILQKYPHACLYIYGAVDADFISQLDIKHNKNIIFKGFVDTLSDAYVDKIISVVPIFQNNGQITRIIDSMSAGVPCFTTHEALSTIDGAKNRIHAVSSKNADDMTTNILHYLSNKNDLMKLSKNGKDLIYKKLNHKNNIDIIYE